MDLQPKEPFANALQQVDVVRSERTLFYNVCYSRLIASTSSTSSSWGF